MYKIDKNDERMFTDEEIKELADEYAEEDGFPTLFLYREELHDSNYTEDDEHDAINDSSLFKERENNNAVKKYLFEKGYSPYYFNLKDSKKIKKDYLKNNVLTPVSTKSVHDIYMSHFI